MLINERRKVGIENLKNPKIFIDYSQTVDAAYEKLEDYNPTKNRRVLIVFNDMIVDIEYKKNLGPIVTGFFSRGRSYKKKKL